MTSVTTNDHTHLLVLPHVRVQNANALTGPHTFGISLTALQGLMWNLERHTARRGWNWAFNAFGVVCHHHEAQTTGGYVRSLRLTRNPVGKDGSTAAIVEEGRIHLELSLVYAVDSPSLSTPSDAAQQQADALRDILARLRVAGGSVLPSARASWHRQRPYLIDLRGDSDKDRSAEFRKHRTRLLPGFALVGRDDLLAQRLDALRQQQPGATALDAWLSLARWNHRYDEATDQWTHDRPRGSGWIVPLAVGYGALGEVLSARSVADTRDATTPARFVESLHSVGEWISPHRLTRADQLLWRPEHDPSTGRYRCRSAYTV